MIVFALKTVTNLDNANDAFNGDAVYIELSVFFPSRSQNFINEDLQSRI
jgi:hypothetical protein